MVVVNGLITESCGAALCGGEVKDVGIGVKGAKGRFSKLLRLGC